MAKRIDRMGIQRNDDITDDTRYGSLYLREERKSAVNDYGGASTDDVPKLANISDAAAGSTCLFHNGEMYVRGVSGTWEQFGSDE